MPPPDHEFDFRNLSLNTTQIKDTIHYDIDASFIDGVSVDPNGEGVVLDGSSGYIDVTPWQFGGAMTVETYVKYDDYVEYAPIFEFCNTHADNSILLRNGGASDGAVDEVQFRNSEGNSGLVRVNTSSFLNLNIWIHIIVSISEDGNVHIYKNGILINTGTITVPADTLRSQHYLGGGFPLSSNRFFDGTIAYIRFWNGTALNGTQVQNLFYNRKNRLMETNDKNLL